MTIVATSAAPFTSSPTARDNPYPGLRPFHRGEEDLFFGRERQVDRMIDKLATRRFLAVVGTSGCGKSSLVNCGLQPALHRGLMSSAGSAWRVAQFRPGLNPRHALAAALAAPGVLFRDDEATGITLSEIVDATLEMSSLGVVDIYEQARLAPDVNLLLVVDQFEEIFRYHRLRGDAVDDFSGMSSGATAFVKLLLEARTHPRIHVVLTMRSDFLGECAQFHGLPEAINEGQYLVPRMSRDETRAAIVGPAETAGCEVDAVLLPRLLNDVGDNPDQLSILQHALNRTWSHWMHEGSARGRVDLEHYEAVGAMAQALDRHAEKAFAELQTDRLKRVCELVFRALTDKGTDARGIRRPTPFAKLCTIAAATPEEVRRVIDVFRKTSRSFLMPPLGEPVNDETVIDISHESLMRLWGRLRAWSDDEAVSARAYRRLAESARLHADGAASLLRDAELRRALEWKARVEPTPAWASQYDGQFDLVMRFLDESLAEQCEDLADVEVARRWQIRRRVVAGLCVLGFIVSALVVAVIVSVSTAFQPGAKDVFIGLLVPVWLGAFPVLSGIAQRRYHRRTRPGIVASLIAAGGQIEPPSVSPRVYRLARWGAWTAGVAGAVYALGSVLFAWTANRDFAQRVESASARVTKSMSANASRSAVMSFPSGEDLRGLSDLRDVLERLDSYQSAGPPLRLRWGMWRGDVLLREGRRVWFDGYRAMLHDRAFGAIVDSLRGLPDAPRPDDDYLERYGWLKTYLIITRNPDRTDVDLLRSVLLREWRRDRRIDPDAAHRAGDQFEFYARELRRASPWETPEDAAVVARARKFLSAFGGLERLYQLMLERVATSAPSVRLAFVAPRTEGVVIAPRDVSHAFTPSGWDFMRDLFTKVNPFVGADRWVLGEENDAAKGTDNLKAQLQRRYREDYALAWRRYLQSLSVARAGALEDEIKQLSVLSSVPSPLFLALDVLSRSMPDDSTLASEFRPVTFLVTLNANAQKASPAAPYINALSELRDALGRADSLLLAGRVSPPVLDGAVRQAQIKEAEARIAAKGLMAPFVADPTTADAARLVASLLIAPIQHADEALQAARRAVRM